MNVDFITILSPLFANSYLSIRRLASHGRHLTQPIKRPEKLRARLSAGCETIRLVVLLHCHIFRVATGCSAGEIEAASWAPPMDSLGNKTPRVNIETHF